MFKINKKYKAHNFYFQPLNYILFCIILDNFMLYLRRLDFFFVMLMVFCILSLGFLVLVVANKSTFWDIEI